MTRIPQQLRLADVRVFRIPLAIIQQTEGILREYGRQEVECRVLWIGRFKSAHAFAVTRAETPRQSVSMVETVVEHEELLRIGKIVYERKETLAIQVHTHPGSAYHSAIDNEYPLTREAGSLSIVVPDFAANSLEDLQKTAVFRLTHEGWLGPLPPTVIADLLVVEP